MKRNILSYLFFLAFFLIGLSACIEDGYTSSASDQPTFSTDTLDLGTIFTDQPSTTHRFTVYNHASKSLNISKIAMSGDNAALFRLNVDGFSGTTFSDVEIRANDSIFVFVETTLPENSRDIPVEVTAKLDFLTNRLTRSVVVAATGRDAIRLCGETLDADQSFGPGKPYLVYDSLVVAPGTTLSLEPGTEMYFHDGAELIVRGTLKSRGAVGKEVTLAGDRTGNVAADISFDIMSRQWGGVYFAPSSRDNEMNYTHVCNTTWGVTVDGRGSDEPVELLAINSRFRNSGDRGMDVIHANLRAYGCEFAEASLSPLSLRGGRHVINQCTLANYYLFTVIGEPILNLQRVTAADPAIDQYDTDDNLTEAEITNTIIYGLGTDISHGDLTGSRVMLRRCLLKSDGSDDDNFVGCIWNQDPLYRTIRNDYYFDYRLQADSPAIGTADPALVAPEAATDRYGLARGANPDLGAYVYTPEEL